MTRTYLDTENGAYEQPWSWSVTHNTSNILKFSPTALDKNSAWNFQTHRLSDWDHVIISADKPWQDLLSNLLRYCFVLIPPGNRIRSSTGVDSDISSKRDCRYRFRCQTYVHISHPPSSPPPPPSRKKCDKDCTRARIQIWRSEMLHIWLKFCQTADETCTCKTTVRDNTKNFRYSHAFCLVKNDAIFSPLHQTVNLDKVLQNVPQRERS